MTTAKMRNIGPKSAAWLRQVGLRSLEDLAAVGTVEAFMRVRRAGFKPGLNLLYVTTFDEAWRVGANEDASFGNKAIAFSAIASWVCVMYFGRMLPFLGNAF